MSNKELITKHSELVNVFSDCDTCEHQVQDPAYIFPYKNESFQDHAYYCISKDENILVTVPTGSGKTNVAVYAIAHYLKKNKKIVYTAPIKALSSEKYSELKNKFGIDKVGISTGDTKINLDAPVVVMTTEILLNALYSYKQDISIKKEIILEDSYIDSIGCVIIDELHIINDQQRGHVYEELLLMLNKDITLVMLTATLNGSREFCNWLSSIKNRVVNLVETTHRIIPLEYSMFSSNKLVKIYDSKFYEYNYDNLIRENINQVFLLNNLTKFLVEKELTPALYFVFSRKNCERFARSITTQLITPEESINAMKTFDKYMHKYEEKYSKLPQYILIKNLIAKGISFHHSGMLIILKNIVEILFNLKFIKVLFCTESLAIGVNLPAKTVVFTELSKYDDNSKQRNLTTAEFRQISGRAGRKGYGDKVGTVIILPMYELISKPTLKSIMFGIMPHVESKFYINYVFILQVSYNDKNIEEFVNKSLYMKDNTSIVIKLKAELENTRLKLVEYNDVTADQNIIEEFTKYEKLTNLELEYSKSGFSLNNKQLKEKKLLNKKFLQESSDYKEKYSKYLEYNATKTLVEEKEEEIYFLEHSTEILSSQIVNILTKLGYFKKEDNKLSIKGVLAAQIHECNGMLLAEMISQNLFEDLEPAEICGLLAIFIEENKKDKQDLSSLSSKNLKSKIDKVNSIIDNITKVEREFKYMNNKILEIHYDFVDIAYMWGSGSEFSEILELKDIYLGNFVKNILSLNNIVQDVISLSKINGNLSSLKNLDLVSKMLIRDIVNVDSLYLIL